MKVAGDWVTTAIF